METLLPAPQKRETAKSDVRSVVSVLKMASEAAVIVFLEESGKIEEKELFGEKTCFYSEAKSFGITKREMISAIQNGQKFDLMKICKIHDGGISYVVR